MFSDIVPVLAAVTELPSAAADVAFAEAWEEAKSLRNEGPDSRTFVDALVLFRAAHPFSLGDLQAGQAARKELDARATGAA